MNVIGNHPGWPRQQNREKQDFGSITAGSTDQEKAITYPIDGKLYERFRQHIAKDKIHKKYEFGVKVGITGEFLIFG